MNESQELGIVGEKIISEFLEKDGYKVIAKNFRSNFGEIDVIAKKDDVLAFVEVKTRKVCYFPISSVVTPSKQKKIIKTAKFFLMKNNIDIYENVCRFDVATVLYGDGNFEVDYIENAFY